MQDVVGAAVQGTRGSAGNKPGFQGFKTRSPDFRRKTRFEKRRLLVFGGPEGPLSMEVAGTGLMRIFQMVRIPNGGFGGNFESGCGGSRRNRSVQHRFKRSHTAGKHLSQRPPSARGLMPTLENGRSIPNEGRVSGPFGSAGIVPFSWTAVGTPHADGGSFISLGCRFLDRCPVVSLRATGRLPAGLPTGTFRTVVLVSGARRD